MKPLRRLFECLLLMIIKVASFVTTAAMFIVIKFCWHEDPAEKSPPTKQKS